MLAQARPDSARTDAEELAVAGVLVAVIAFGHVLPVTGEPSEWLQYVLLGTTIPLAVLGLASGVPRGLGLALATVGLTGGIGYIVATARWIAVLLALAQGFLTAAVLRQRPRAIELGVAALAWAAALTIGRNSDLHFDALQGYLESGRVGSLALTVGGFLAVVGSFALRERDSGVGSAVRSRILSLMAGAILALESFRVDYLFDFLSVHHWGVFTAPAEAVRQGGWLLWDTPATYGPGSTLAIALMPTGSVWDGFFWLNALACTASAWLLFSLLRERLHLPVALLLALCAVLWLPGARQGALGGGVLVTPNAGPFRFLWCQILLVLAARRPRSSVALVGGCGVWLLGCLWSSESAAYSSAAWLPAYVLLVWDTAVRTRWKWLALPPSLAASAMVAVAGYYVLRLGHGPDWYAVVEASLGIRGGVEALPIVPTGPVAVLIVLLWATAAGAVRALAGASRPADAAPVVSCLAVLWATSSYFVGRSHSIIVTDLLPTLLLVGFVVLRSAPASLVVRAALVATCTAVLLLGLHDRSGWVSRRPLAERWAFHVDHRRPILAPDVQAFFAAAGIRPGDAIAYSDLNVMPAWPPGANQPSADRIWLPIQPMTELVPVRAERRALYVRRFIARAHMGGWLVENTWLAFVPGIGDMTWLGETLGETHRPTRSLERGPWRATYYEPTG
jgi:hypothetical protein